MGVRQAGILLPVFSLPSPHGIGTLGREAEEFIDNLAAAKQRIWQILPLCPPGYGASPYSSYSTHAGTSLFIDMDRLVEKGWLTTAELDGLDWGSVSGKVDYDKVYRAVDQALALACKRAGEWQTDPDFVTFQEQNSWVDDYALFMALKKRFQVSWLEWPPELRDRHPEALQRARCENAAEIEVQRFAQWVFSTQWDRIHQYAKRKGVKILGDIPIYVSLDSVDTWVNPELFQLDNDRKPRFVAGVPPDGFSPIGQVWGNPLYNWDEHRRTGYSWWKNRVGQQLQRADMLRIDHFRGLESYFSIPAGSQTAASGHWEPGPGIEFFNALKQFLGDLPLVLEDLGYLTKEVLQLREDTGKPGIQLVQFAFDSREPASYWPYNMPRNAVVYTGTHDNNTLKGWFKTLAPTDQDVARTYCAAQGASEDELPWYFITLALTSVADTCIIPLADYLGLDSEGRINTPAQVGGNWEWRLSPAQADRIPWERISHLTTVSGRDNTE